MAQRDEEGGGGRPRRVPRRPHAEEALLGEPELADPRTDHAGHLERSHGRERPRAPPDPQLRPAPGPHHRRAGARARRALLPRLRHPVRARRARSRPRVRARRAPKVLEIGFGMGETTAEIAAAHPEIDYLGIEVHSPGVGSLLKRIDALGLTNVRIVQHDAVEVLEHMIRAGRARRRAPLLSRPVAEEAPPQAPAAPARRSSRCSRARLKPGGLCARRDRLGGLRAADPGGARRGARAREHRGRVRAAPGDAPETKFERRGVKLGHRVWDVVSGGAERAAPALRPPWSMLGVEPTREPRCPPYRSASARRSRP